MPAMAGEGSVSAFHRITLVLSLKSVSLCWKPFAEEEALLLRSRARAEGLAAVLLSPRPAPLFEVAMAMPLRNEKRRSIETEVLWILSEGYQLGGWLSDHDIYRRVVWTLDFGSSSE
jgi:hypothetical protein